MNNISSAVLAKRLLEATYQLEYEQIMTLTSQKYREYYDELEKRGHDAPYDCVVPQAYAQGPAYSF